MPRRVVLLCGGVAAFLCISAIPFLIRIDSPLQASRLSERLIGVRGMLEGLTADALEARLGLLQGYDDIATGHSDLRAQVEDLEQTIASLPAGLSATLNASFAPFAEGLRERDAAIAAFPAENALLDNSIRLLRATFERATSRVTDSGRPQHSSMDDLLDMYAATLQCYSELDAGSVRLLQERLDAFELQLGPNAPGSAIAMLGHARTLLQQKTRVDSILQRLLDDSLTAHLDGTLLALAGEEQKVNSAISARRTWTYGVALGLALLVCVCVCFGVLRQNRELQLQVTEREKSDAQSRRLEIELRQAQKLEAVGQLAQGIAHEINTPTQYVSDNTRFVAEGMRSIVTFVEYCRDRATAALAGQCDARELGEGLASKLAECDIDMLAAEIPPALHDSLDGLERIAKIVRSMKTLAHQGGGTFENVDLNTVLQDSVTVATHEWKYVAEVVTDLDPNMGRLPCLGGELSQVFLNMIVNAAHAIGEATPEGAGHKGTITVRTRREEHRAVVRIEDTGAGIPESIRHRVFEPFFTTKPVGKGSGQGLAIAYSVVVDKHQGTIDIESEVGKGTTFVIGLPLERLSPEEMDPTLPLRHAA